MTSAAAISPLRRRAFFALLYFSEGAPIGYIWWAMPTRLRASGMPVEEVALITSLLTLPWALKFLWAPAIDRLRSPWWGYRAWITIAQIVMGLALLPLCLFPIEQMLAFITPLLVGHAVAAATQDVAIDALAIATVPEADRGKTTGWMQAGMLLGRALFGGLALAAEQWIGARAVVGILIACIWVTLIAVWTSPWARAVHLSPSGPRPHFVAPLVEMLRRRATWLALAVALTAGAGFEAIGGLMGPYLLDRGSEKGLVGWFFALPVIAAMIVGGLAGGWAADRWGHRRVMAAAVVLVFGFTGLLWLADALAVSVVQGRAGILMAAAIPIYLCIGLLTASSYALFMDFTNPELGGTQFSTYMGATNLCEVWAVALAGSLVVPIGYNASFVAVAGLSLCSLAFLRLLPDTTQKGTPA